MKSQETGTCSPAFHAGNAGSNPAGDVAFSAPAARSRDHNVTGPRRVHAKRSEGFVVVEVDPSWPMGPKSSARAAAMDGLLVEVSRLRRRTDKARRGRQVQPALPRLMANIEREHDGACWLWTAAKDSKGYGVISAWGRLRGAHRVAYTLLVGPIPPDMTIMHMCDTPACVNPLHMQLGTHAENMADASEKGRMWNGRGIDHRPADCKPGKVTVSSAGAPEPGISGVTDSVTTADRGHGGPDRDR